MSSTRSALVSASLVVLAACGDAEEERAWPPARGAPRADLLGCYALYDGRGRAVSDTTFYGASPRVRLDSAAWGTGAGRASPGVYRLVRAGAAGREYGAIRSDLDRGPLWFADSLSDSVRLSFTNGFSGAFLVLHAPPGGADTLRGRIGVNWDFGPPYTTQRGRAWAIRVPCGTTRLRRGVPSNIALLPTRALRIAWPSAPLLYIRPCG